MASWLKIGYFTDSQEEPPDYWMSRGWISDGPGRSSSRWKTHAKPRQGDPYPLHGPQYDVGDRLVIYITQRGVCPAILEVLSEPRWDPRFVDSESERREGDRWGVVTDVDGLWTLDLAIAPDLEEIGVAASSIQQKGHILLEDWQYEQAERLIARKRTTSKLSQPGLSNIEIPIEKAHIEGYEIASKTKVTRAVRREAELVGDYQIFLEGKGDEVTRNELLPLSAHAMYSDLFNKTRRHLVEAKASATRGDIRMAIGQLADYKRFISKIERCAVLLGAKPHPDLIDLLDSQEIATIWRSGNGFADNAEGAFT
jgi:hypothetical protein